MGERIPVDELERRTRAFFDEVIKTLKERNRVRGDSYLEMNLLDFSAMFRDKGGRIQTASLQEDCLTDPDKLAEILDSVKDEAGYAALCWIWLEEHKKSC